MQKYMINPTLQYTNDENGNLRETIFGDGYIIAAANRKELIDIVTEKSYTNVNNDDATRLGKTLIIYTVCVKVPNKMKLETISAERSIELANKNIKTKEIRMQSINPRPRCVTGSKKHLFSGNDYSKVCKTCGIRFRVDEINSDEIPILVYKNSPKNWWDYGHVDNAMQMLGGKKALVRTLLERYSRDHHIKPVEVE